MKSYIPHSVMEVLLPYISALSVVDKGPYSREAWEQVADTRYDFEGNRHVWFLAAGCSREAYGVECEDGEHRVIKIETLPAIGSNKRERFLWDMVKDTEWARHFFGLYEESYKHPEIIVQDMAKTKGSLKDERLFYMKAEELELKLKSQRIHLADMRYSANGVIVGGEVKLFDYGHCRIK